MKISMEEFKLNNDCTLTINGTSYQAATLGINTDICNCVCESPKSWNERKEIKKMNEFLKIKKDQELERNDKEYQLKKEVILKDDKIQKILKDAENEINDIYKAEGQLHRISLRIDYHITEENRKKIEELKKENNEKEDKIIAKYKEIEALVDDIPAKDRIEIYKMYNIM